MHSAINELSSYTVVNHRHGARQPEHAILANSPHGGTRDKAGALSHFRGVQLFGTLWTRAGQASLSLRFSKQE